MNERHSKEHVCVLRTGRIHEHDLASATLNEHGIPFFKEMDTSSGTRLAMPMQPTMSPGTYFSIFVPEQISSEAESILNSLPIEHTVSPTPFQFLGPERNTKHWKYFAWAMIGFGLLVLIVSFSV